MQGSSTGQAYRVLHAMRIATRVPHWPYTWMLHPIGVPHRVVIYPHGQTYTQWLPFALAFLEHSALYTFIDARFYNLPN